MSLHNLYLYSWRWHTGTITVFMSSSINSIICAISRTYLYWLCHYKFYFPIFFHACKFLLDYEFLPCWVLDIFRLKYSWIFFWAAVKLLRRVWSLHAFKLYYIETRIECSLDLILTHYCGNVLQSILPNSPSIMTFPISLSGRNRNYFQPCPGDHSFNLINPFEWYSLQPWLTPTHAHANQCSIRDMKETLWDFWSSSLSLSPPELFPWPHRLSAPAPQFKETAGLLLDFFSLCDRLETFSM